MDNAPLPQDIPADELGDGYELKPQISIVLRTARFCSTQDVEDRRISRQRATDSGHSEFIAKCAHHGRESIFDTATGACLSCLADNAGLPLQARYQAAAGSCYADRCEEHGGYTARFGEVGCSLCKRPETAPRILAQRAGALRYDDICATCGPSLFSTRSGRCVTCFTVAGQSRTATPPAGRPQQVDNPRAVARRAGDKSYLATCATHGETPHSVAHAKCLRCFNAMGHPRPVTNS